MTWPGRQQESFRCPTPADATEKAPNNTTFTKTQNWALLFQLLPFSSFHLLLFFIFIPGLLGEEGGSPFLFSFPLIRLPVPSGPACGGAARGGCWFWGSVLGKSLGNHIKDQTSSPECLACVLCLLWMIGHCRPVKRSLMQSGWTLPSLSYFTTLSQKMKVKRFEENAIF